MQISAIFANAHLKTPIYVPFLEPWVTKVTEDTVGLQTYKLGFKVI
jgi:hypothetical protein